MYNNDARRECTFESADCQQHLQPVYTPPAFLILLAYPLASLRSWRIHRRRDFPCLASSASLFTHFLFLDPHTTCALRRTHAHTWTCVYSEVRLHVSQPLLSPCVNLHIHVATYISQYKLESSGAVIPNRTWLRAYVFELCQEFEPVNSDVHHRTLSVTFPSAQLLSVSSVLWSCLVLQLARMLRPLRRFVPRHWHNPPRECPKEIRPFRSYVPSQLLPDETIFSIPGEASSTRRGSSFCHNVASSRRLS